MKLRLAFLGSLLLVGLIGYWGHDLPQLNAPAEALPNPATAPPQDTPLAQNQTAQPSATPLSDQVIEMATGLANRSRYVDAIALLRMIPAEDQNFSQADQLQEQWGKAILGLGQAKLKQGKIAEGRAILKSIPPKTAAHAQAARLLRP